MIYQPHPPQKKYPVTPVYLIKHLLFLINIKILFQILKHYSFDQNYIRLGRNNSNKRKECM